MTPTTTSRRVVIGVNECGTSMDRGAVLVTYALGSCIAVALYDPAARVGGLVHFMLPHSSMSPENAAANPFMCADTAIPLLLKRVLQLGGRRERLVVTAAGGATVAAVGEDRFEIGLRNCRAMRQILGDLGFQPRAEHTGGDVARTVGLEIDSGAFWVRATSSLRRILRGER